MSLNFSYHGKSDTKKWTKQDWENYNGLIWATLVVGIGKLNAKSAAAFCRRANAMKVLKQEICPEDIEKFYGLHTNVTTLTGAQWARQFMSAQREESAAWVKEVTSCDARQ